MMITCAVLALLLLAGCAGEPDPPALPEGSCLQLEVSVDDGFRVDGRPLPIAEVGPALTHALEDSTRTAIVDVRCGNGVTMASVRQLHETMLERGLHRIQYFRPPDPPIPYTLPPAEMQGRLANLPEEQLCVIMVETSGEASISGSDLSTALVEERLAANPGIVFVIHVPDDTRYVDFARALGTVTGAGAERVALRLGAD